MNNSTTGTIITLPHLPYNNTCPCPSPWGTYHITTFAPVHPTAAVTGKVLLSDQLHIRVLQKSLVHVFLEWRQWTKHHQLIWKNELYRLIQTRQTGLKKASLHIMALPLQGSWSAIKSLVLRRKHLLILSWRSFDSVKKKKQQQHLDLRRIGRDFELHARPSWITSWLFALILDGYIHWGQTFTVDGTNQGG